MAAVARRSRRPKKPEPRLVREDAPVTVAQHSVSEKAEMPAPAPQCGPAPAAALVALAQQPQPGSGEPINPIKVKTITVKAGMVQTASLVRAGGDAPQATVAPPHFAKSAPWKLPCPRRLARGRVFSARCRSRRCTRRSRSAGGLSDRVGDLRRR